MKFFPQIKGIITKLYKVKPKKPNSALRKVSVVKVTKLNREKQLVYLPGTNNNLNIYNTVLIKHGRTKDLVGFKYRIIRGTYDSNPMIRTTSRSKYGCKLSLIK